MARHYDDTVRLRRLAINAVLYPTLIVIVAIYVIPIFKIILMPMIQGHWYECSG